MSYVKYWPVTNNKYHAIKTTVDGITFDSRKEANYYCELKMLKQAGEVLEIELQVPYELQPKYWYKGKAIRAITYVADFMVTYADGRIEVIDTKGVRTEAYKIKKRLLLYQYPGIDFREV